MSSSVIKREEFRSKINGNSALLIPCLNEGSRLISQVQKLEREIGDQIYLIIIDGDSSDGSIEKVIAMKPKILRCILISKAKLGLSFDLYSGLNYLSKEYDYVLTLDGNGKDDLSRLMDMLDFAKNNRLDFVQGSRFVKNGSSENLPMDRLLGIKLFLSPIVSIYSRKYFSDPSNQCRVLSANALEIITKVNPTEFKRYDYFFFIPIKLSRSKLLTAEFPVKRSYPKNGPTPTHIRRSAYAKLAIDLIRMGLRWRKY